MTLRLSILALLGATALHASTHYVDWVGGSDANDGLTTGTAWKRCPGMNSFSGTYTHTPGDIFVFKGGTVWPVAAFQLRITKGGSSDGIRDLYTSDSTWFTGPFWTQPVWDFQDTALGTGFNSGAGILLDAAGGSFGYITFQFLNVKRHRGYLSPADFGACTFTLASAPHHITWDRCTIQDWSIPTPAAGQDGTGGGGICMVNGGGAGCIVTGCVLTQAGAVNGCRSGRALSLFGTIEFCTIHDTPNAFLGSGTVHDCTVYNIVAATDPLAHENGIYCQAPSTVYNNIVHNLDPNASAIYLSPSFSGGTGYDLVYNNLVYNTGAQAPIQVDSEGATPQLTGSHLYNNTLVANGGYCIRAVYRAGQPNLGLLDMVNNHLITSGGTFICYDATNSGCATVTTVTNVANLQQSVTAATADGYTQANGYAPASGAAPTVGTGNTLSIVFTNSLNGVTRSGAWDRGAYQFAGTPPPPPTPSRVVLRTTLLRADLIRTKP